MSSNIPAMVDCDTGFGNAINVRRTVASMIRAGAAGLFIEDQVSPKRCAFVAGKEVISLEEAVGKYRAAIDVRNELDPDFIIMARTDVENGCGRKYGGSHPEGKGIPGSRGGYPLCSGLPIER